MALDCGEPFIPIVTAYSLWPSDAMSMGKCKKDVTPVSLSCTNPAIWWHRSRSTVAQAMACCPMASSHYLNQCCLTITRVLWHSLEGNFTGNAQDNHPWYEFEDWKLTVKLGLQPYQPRVNDSVIKTPQWTHHRLLWGQIMECLLISSKSMWSSIFVISHKSGA